MPAWPRLHRIPFILDHSAIQVHSVNRLNGMRRRFSCWRMSLSANRIPPLGQAAKNLLGHASPEHALGRCRIGANDVMRPAGAEFDRAVDADREDGNERLSRFRDFCCWV
jgi:hypothetical protein